MDSSNDLDEEKLGIVAFSFAMRDSRREPNPCNARLANEVIRAKVMFDRPVAIVAQWEIAKALELRGMTPDLIVDMNADGSYLNSQDVWRAADKYLRRENVRDIVMVAQPFLHMAKVRRFAQAPYRQLQFDVSPIGFDPSPENKQWWTKGPLRLLAYAIGQFFFAKRARRRDC